MSIWARIADALSALASGEGLSAVFERLRSPPERSVAFTIAVIAICLYAVAYTADIIRGGIESVPRTQVAWNP